MGIMILAAMGFMFGGLVFFPQWRLGKWSGQTYWVITLVAALLIWASQNFAPSFIYAALMSDGATSPIRILLLFFSFTLLATFLDEVGLIRYLAYMGIRRAGSSQPKLFFIWYVMVAVTTLVTANDIVILTLTPFMIYVARYAKISPMPYLWSQFVAANTWSMMLIIGNPTNIYLGSMFGLDFMSYFKIMIWPTMVTGALSYLMLYLMFFRALKSPITKPSLSIKSPHPSYRLGLVAMGAAIGLMMISTKLGIGMDLLTVGAAIFLVVSMLILYPEASMTWRTIKRLPFSIAIFFVSMAVIIQGMNMLGWTAIMFEWLKPLPTIYGYGVSSFIASNLMNNIPMTLWFTEVMAQQGAPSIAAIYATIIGSNIGALLTPVGALAGLMWMTILREKNVDFGFKKFMGYGFVFGAMLLGSALGMLDVVLK